MVTKFDTHKLLHLIADLENLNTECMYAPDFGPNVKLSVKGLGGTLDTLEELQDDLEEVSETIEKVERIKSSMKRWINKLEKNYSEDEEEKLPVNLTKEDAKALQLASESWITQITESFNDKGTHVIKEDVINDIFSDQIMMFLDEDAKKDLREGINVLLHSFPTAATMIFFRVAERIIQKFYRNSTGEEPKNKSWGQMLQVLDAKQNVDKILMGYLHYLNKKRIDAAHPYRRYTQEEAERILLYIKDLIEETNFV